MVISWKGFIKVYNEVNVIIWGKLFFQIKLKRVTVFCTTLLTYDTMLEIIVGIAGLIVSIVVWISQRKFNTLSMRPLCTIEFGDYECKIEVQVSNKWVGPAIINNITVNYNNQKSIQISKFLNILNPNNIIWEDYTLDFSDKIISPGGKICLFKMIFKHSDNDLRIRMKQILSKSKFIISYKDIFNNLQSNSERTWDWFSKNG